MIESDNNAKWMKEGIGWLQSCHYLKAEECFRKCVTNLNDELYLQYAMGLAEAILKQEPDKERAREVYNLLLGVFFHEKISSSTNMRRQFLDLLCKSATITDLDVELADLIHGHEPACITTRTSLSMLKAFYFSKASKGFTLGEMVEIARRRLEKRIRDKPTLTAESFTLEFAKEYSSSTPLQDLAGDSVVGGGYFLALGGYGCVIDPGHHFLENFYKLPRTIADINCIIITHFHDDHYANLPALLSLLFQRKKKTGQQVRLLLDTQTYDVFHPLIDPSNPKSVASGDSGILDPSMKKPFLINNDIELCTLPTQHSVFGRHTGVGLHFYIPQKNVHLVITGDTGWNSEIGKVYSNFRNLGITLVAHVSSARPEEELIDTLIKEHEMFYDQHLCIHGLCKLIENVHPQRLILSEIGEEIREVIDDLKELIHHFYGKDMEIGIGNMKAGPYRL